MEEKKGPLPEELSGKQLEKASGGNAVTDFFDNLFSGLPDVGMSFTYRCPYCGELFKGAKSLEDHIKKEHSGKQ